jgi:hypothetical protein
MNRVSSIRILAACLACALGATGCFAQSTSDDLGQSNDRHARGAHIVSGDEDTSKSPPTVLFISRTAPGAEQMGPEPDPWKGRAQGGDTGGPEPDPWNQNGDGRKPNPNPDPNPTSVSLSGGSGH